MMAAVSERRQQVFFYRFLRDKSLQYVKTDKKARKDGKNQKIRWCVKNKRGERKRERERERMERVK